jgi:drug/metabolite transporter (DMT)-like permease
VEAGNPLLAEPFRTYRRGVTRPGMSSSVTHAPTRPRTRRLPGLAVPAVLVTVLAWASAFVAIRWVGHSFTPGPLALGRLLVGAAALGVPLLARRQWVAPTRREWLLVALCELAWFAAYNVALNAAERRVDAGTTAMLVNVGPILIALLAGVLLGEAPPVLAVLGGLVCLVGVALSRRR